MSTKLWHNRFEDDWMRAFPLGNGRIGVMLYGNPDKERIVINEESLWSGKQIEEKCSASQEALDGIRGLLFAQKYEEAAALCRKTFLANPEKVRFYESVGEIYIDFFDGRKYENYRKELELNEAVARVSYTKEDTNYKSEAFVSEKYDVFVYRITTDNAPISCNITMKREQDAYTSALNDNTLILNGRITYRTEKGYGEGDEGMAFGARIHIASDGTFTTDKKSVTVKNATYVTIYSAFATNYNVEKFDLDNCIDYRAKMLEAIDEVKNVDYEEVKAQHIREHQRWFNTLSFETDAPAYEDIPTDERLERVKNGFEDNDLYVLYYNFGRYLLIESSGKNARLPANLQGIWCEGFRPPWGSDYHTNINLQMNYWPAEPANMSDTVKPFIHFMKMISGFGVQTAKELFVAKGWAVNHTTDVFGRTGVHDSVDCGFFPMAGPWLCLNLWEHYEYSHDIEILKQIYPIIKGSCEFVMDYLIESKHGYLVTSPSNSPENRFYYIDENGEKKRSMFTYGATIDFEIIYAIFTRVICACQILDTDLDFAGQLQKTLAKLPPLRVSERYGTVCEWIKDYEEVEPGHRHISHLFGLYPGDQINETNEEIYSAAKNTIARRLDNGGGANGWSRAWIINFYARLKDSENALANLRLLIERSTAENLFDMHPPFQIDGNFGAVAGITEMLVQSHLGSPDERIIEILPALPKQWKKGFIRGVKVRGGFVLDIEWQDNQPVRLEIKACCTSSFRLKITDGMKDIKTSKEYTVKNHILEMYFEPDETAEIIFR